MGNFQKGLEILRSKGISTLAEKAIFYPKKQLTKIEKKVKKKVYSVLAKVCSPVEYHGVLIPTNSEKFDYEIRSRFMKGDYEKEEIKAIQKYVDEEHDIIDLGASTGFLTVYLLETLKSSPRAVAVEGNQRLIPLIERVRKMNEVKFEIENSAYHSTLENVNFNIHHLTVGGSVQRETNKKEKVNAICLEEIIRKYGIREFICVVDIEGGEADLINNEIHTLEEKCNTLLVEFHEGYAEGIMNAKRTLESSNLKMIDNVDGIHVYKKTDVDDADK